MTSTCQGRWTAERQLPESDVRVMTCSECRELWAIDHATPCGRSLGTFPPGTPDMTILAAALEHHTVTEDTTRLSSD